LKSRSWRGPVTRLSAAALRRHNPAEERRAPLLIFVAAIGLLLALAMATAAIATSWDANPQGDWDAWAIWNLRARFLASSGALAQRAWSPVLGASTHAEYPLLLSSFVARCWAFSHSFSTVVPAATSYVFFLALIALVAGGMAALRGPTLGMLAALVLASTPALLHQVPNQYADVPLACYFAGAIVFALLDRPILAGIFAGCAAWTKDEGVLFLVVLLVITAAWKRRTAVATLAGAAPAAALAIVFKTWLARGNAGLLSTSLPGAGKRLADAGRYGATMAAFGREFAHMGVGWYHPILPVIALAVVLRFDRERRRDAAYCAALAGFLLLQQLSPKIRIVLAAFVGLRRFLPALARLPHRPHARRAPRLASAPGQQLGGLPQQPGRQPVERRALPHPAGIGIVQIQVGLFTKRHAQIARIAHQQQRRHGAQALPRPARPLCFSSGVRS
jgi:hypothetical protein